MMSYIFKDTRKNMLAIVFTALYIVVSAYNRVDILLNEQDFSIGVVFNLLPSAMILIYLLTLDQQYKFKEFLFPIAFSIMIILLIYTSVFSTINYLKMMDSIEGIGSLMYSIVCNAILFVAYVFCVIGSISNFKKAKFLKIGMLILIAICIVNLVLQAISLTAVIIQFKSAQSGVPESILTEFIKSTVKSLISTVALMLFYFGIFNLTFNKDSENPQKRLFKSKEPQYEAQFEDEQQEIHDGSWRCMACGKILSNDIPRCECGYRK